MSDTKELYAIGRVERDKRLKALKEVVEDGMGACGEHASRRNHNDAGRYCYHRRVGSGRVRRESK